MARRLSVTRSSPLALATRRGLAEAADPERATGMQAYMKSSMPYRGVMSKPLRAICKRIFAEHPLETCEEWQAAVLELWRGARFREERYVAIELTGLSRHRSCQTPAVIPMYEEMIVSGAWWDYVDGIASDRMGGLLRSHPKQLRPLMLRWSRDANLWKRRTSIICQISFKRETDLELLYACIGPNLADKDFFIRKAIGWALRSYAWTDPNEVARYVHEHEAQLSGLSRREALKNIG